MKINKTIINVAYLIIAVVMATDTVYCAQTGDSMDVKFTGTFLLSTPCTINNSQVIDVAFGNVGVDKVDGVAYEQKIPFVVDCKGAANTTSLNLTMSGVAVAFDDAAIKTNADGLGIRIKADGIPMKLNKPKVTTLKDLETLKLTAVPVKDPDKSLTEQPFTAVATLTADYQ